jgi:hypothetical protein
MESPQATIAVVGVVTRTSMAFNQGIDVIRVLNGTPDSDAVRSPAPLSVMNDVTSAPLCWLASVCAGNVDADREVLLCVHCERNGIARNRATCLDRDGQLTVE